MEKSIAAILIKADERKDNDYFVRLFSAEGIISAVFRGVRKAGSKLKYAAQPMAFCLFELTGRQTPVITGASQIEDFSSIAADIVEFTSCMIMLEAADYSSAAVDCAESFLSLLKCIKAVIYNATDARLAAIKYMQKLLFLSGFYRPERGGGEVKDARSLAAAVAGSYLDDLKNIKADSDIVNAALKATSSLFERFFDCRINSCRFFG